MPGFLGLGPSAWPEFGTPLDPSHPLGGWSHLWVLNQGMGTIACDLVSGVQAVFSGTTLPTWTGAGGVVTAAQAYLASPVVPLPTWTLPITFVARVILTSTTPSKADLIGTRAAGANYAIRVNNTTGTPVLGWEWGASSGDFSTTLTVPTNVEMLLALVLTSANRTAYVFQTSGVGSQVSSGAMSGSPGSGAIDIGASAADFTGRCFPGATKMVGAYPGVLTQQQLQDLWEQPYGFLLAPATRRFYAPSSGSTATGVGTSSGTSAASGVGASLVASSGSSAGTSTATAVGSATASSVATASGTSTASGVGSAGSVAVASAAGSSTAAAAGASSSAAAGTSSGTSTAAGTGSSTATAVGAASGTSTATGVSSTPATTTATIDVALLLLMQPPPGTSSQATGTATGISTATGVGASQVASIGSSAGTSTASGVGATGVASTGAATGTSVVLAAGTSLATSVATASGSSTASGVGSSAGSGASIATASGTSTASGIGASIAYAVGTAAGTSTATATANAGPTYSTLPDAICGRAGEVTPLAGMLRGGVVEGITPKKPTYPHASIHLISEMEVWNTGAGYYRESVYQVSIFANQDGDLELLKDAWSDAFNPKMAPMRIARGTTFYAACVAGPRTTDELSESRSGRPVSRQILTMTVRTNRAIPVDDARYQLAR